MQLYQGNTLEKIMIQIGPIRIMVRTPGLGGWASA